MPEPIIDNQNDQLEGKTTDELAEMLQQELQPEETPAQPPEADKPDEADPKPPADPALAEIQERLARAEKRIADKEQFILRQANEIGMLRKQVKQAPKDVNLDDIPDEEFHANPKDAVKKALAKVREAEQAEKEKEQEDKESQAKNLEEIRTIYREAINKWAPDYEEKRVPELLEMLKQDKAPDELVKTMREDPFATLPPPVVFQMLKRVELANRVKELEGKLAEATKKPGQLVNKMQSASRAKPVTTGSAPSASAHKSLADLTEADIDKMSRDELEKLYKGLK